MHNTIPVLTVNRVGFLGGVERIIVSCGQALRSRGFHPLVACPTPGELAREAARCDIEVLGLGIDRTKATFHPLTLVKLVHALRAGRRDVTALARSRDVRLLHAHHPVSALYAVPASRSLKIPLVLHVHETLPVHTLYRAVMRQVIPHCAAIICVSERSRELMRALGAPAERLRVIYNGADPGFEQPAKPVTELSDAGPHVGMFGVLEPRKGQDVFIEAVGKIANQAGSARFWIVGDLSFSENSAYVSSLRNAIAAGGLSERVMLVGHRRDVRDWMARMDVIVLPSRNRESLPTALIEGAILGRPLVATDVGGVREIIAHGSSGLVVPPGDPGALAAAILLALGPEGAGFGKAAQVQALQRFTFDRFGDDMATVYRSVLTPPISIAT